MAQVKATSTVTGDERLIPEHWLEHPVLGERWSQTADQEAASEASETPDASWTIQQMRDYAEGRFDLTGLTRHADILAAVTGTPTDPDNGNGGNDPAANE